MSRRSIALFRLIGARRNIYVWMLAASYLCGAFRVGYMTICAWAAVTAVVHVVRFRCHLLVVTNSRRDAFGS